MSAVKLKYTQVAAQRQHLLEQQGGLCAICRLRVTDSQAVLDHDHATGAVRGVLHRGCNSLLGKLENNAARYGVRELAAFTSGVGAYLRTHAVNVTGLTHPTFKTEDEKREQRNAKRRAARAASRDAVK